MPPKLTLQKVVERANVLGFACLSTKYVDSKTKMEWRCTQGHKFVARYNDIDQNHGCRKCFAMKNSVRLFLTKNEVSEQVERLGYRLSGPYIMAKFPLPLTCPKGHSCFVRLHDLREGHGCGVCDKISVEEIENICKERGGKFVPTVEVSTVQNKGVFICGLGHKWESRISSVIHQKTWCPHCLKISSKKERELFDVVKLLYFDAHPNVRRLLKEKNFEIDIYVPSLRKGIEFDGTYWHSSPKAKAREQKKNFQCAEVGIDLLRITEKEYVDDKNAAIAKVISWLKGGA